MVLPTKEAQQTVKFALARIGNQNAVVISRLVGGSAAAEAGVRPGQRLLAISDPMRGGDSTLWHLNDRPSMRFVRDALSMRSGDSITFLLSRESTLEPSKEPLASIDVSDNGAAVTSTFDASLFDDETPPSPANSSDSADSTESEGGQGSKQTVRQKLESGQQRQTDFERRQQRRKEFFQQETKRDDGRLIITAAAVVLLPAIAILAFAYFSGYLDTLNDSYTTYR